MTSKVNVANLALARIGGGIISSLKEDTQAGKAANVVYDTVVELCLSERDWWFARKYMTTDSGISLLSTVEDQNDDWNYVFQLPSDVVRIWALYSGQDYDLREHHYLYTNDSDPSVRATELVTDPNKWRPWFLDCVVTRMSAELSMNLQGRDDRQQANMAYYHNKVLPIADMRNRQESPKDVKNQSSWLTARGQGNTYAQKVKDISATN